MNYFLGVITGYTLAALWWAKHRERPRTVNVQIKGITSIEEFKSRKAINKALDEAFKHGQPH
jgi:hypothetical protein